MKQGLSHVASKQPSGFGVRRWCYYGGGSWNKASAFCLKELCFFYHTMVASGKKKKRLGEKHFLVGICMKSLVQLPPVRFQARDNY